MEEIDGLQSESSVGSRDVLQAVVVVVSGFFSGVVMRSVVRWSLNRTRNNPHSPSTHPPTPGAPQELLPDASSQFQRSSSVTSAAIRKVVEVSAPNVT